MKILANINQDLQKFRAILTQMSELDFQEVCKYYESWFGMEVDGHGRNGKVDYILKTKPVSDTGGLVDFFDEVMTVRAGALEASAALMRLEMVAYLPETDLPDQTYKAPEDASTNHPFGLLSSDEPEPLDEVEPTLDDNGDVADETQKWGKNGGAPPAGDGSDFIEPEVEEEDTASTDKNKNGPKGGIPGADGGWGGQGPGGAAVAGLTEKEFKKWPMARRQAYKKAHPESTFIPESQQRDADGIYKK